MAKANAIAPEAVPAPNSIPDWVEETPAETEYTLCVFDGDGGCSQEITVTRDEYLQLKQHLAEMRGHVEASVPISQESWKAFEVLMESLKK